MKLLILFISSCIVLSCETQSVDIPDCFQSNMLDTVFIGYEPINMEKINSKYDDYNSYVGYTYTTNNLLIFSTNRSSLGDNFDIISYSLSITSDFSRYDTTIFKYYVMKILFFTKFFLN